MATLHAFCAHAVAIAQWMLHASIAATVLAAAVFTLQMTFGRWLTPSWRYRLWGLVVLKLMLPALPVTPAKISNVDWLSLAREGFARLAPDTKSPPAETAQGLPTATKMSVVVTYAAPHSNSDLLASNRGLHRAVAVGQSTIDVPTAATALWLCVVVLLLGRLTAQNLSLARRIKSAFPVTDPTLLALLGDCRRAAGVSRSTSLLITDIVRIPAAAGVWRAGTSLCTGSRWRRRIDRKTPVTLHLRNVKVSKLLATVLDEVSTGRNKLGYRVDEGVLMISTADQLMQDAVTRVYDIRDLLVDVPDFVSPDVAATTQAASPREERVTLIIKLIEDVIASDTWRDAGGQIGMIRELQGQLIVIQTPENQALLVKLLDQLRDSRSIQVTIEARFISCSEPVARKLLADCQLARVAADDPAPGVGFPAPRPGISGKAFFLDDAQVERFLKTIEASSEASLLGMPRLTLFNGQRAFVQVTSNHPYVSEYATVRTPDGQTRFDPVLAAVDPGLVMNVQATAAADRKSVTLTLRPKVSVLLGMKQTPWPSRPAGSTLVIDVPRIKSSELETTISVPDHGTLILGGMEDPGIGSGIDSAVAATRPAGSPRYLFVMVRPTLIVERQTPRAQVPLEDIQIAP